MTEQVSDKAFRDAMRRTASGVSVITTFGAHGAAGLTVSTLQSLSLDPPSVAMCVNVASKSLAILLANSRFVASVLSAEQAHVAAAFSNAQLSTNERLMSGRWRVTSSGSRVLEGALCNFICDVATVFEFGSHKIVVGKVVDVCVENVAPLVYANRNYCKLAS